MSAAAAASPSEMALLPPEGNRADVENESHSAFNVRQSAPPTVKKQLFQTPAAQPGKLHALSGRSPATPIIAGHDNNSITKRYYRRQTASLTTPHATRPAPGPSRSTARRRPSFAKLRTTPGMRRNYVSITPDMWRGFQMEDLSAWLNYELVDASLSSACPAMDNISDSAVFLKQLSDTHHLYKSPEIQQVLAKVDKEIRMVRFFISKEIRLATHHESKEKLIALLLLNYHPSWLLVALCATLGINFGISLDQAMKEARRTTPRVDYDRIFMSVLEDAIKTHLFANDRPGIDLEKASVSDKRKSSDSLKHESYNGLVLQRVLHLIFLLDQAKQSREPVILTDPPLFRYDSEMISSKDVIEQIGRDFLREQGNVSRFLAHRLYKVTYVTPLFERDSLVVRNLSEDVRDGTRLCKLASIMVKDRKMLSNIRRVKNGMSKKDILRCHLGNVSLALSKMQEYATTHVQSSFEWRGTQQDVVNQKIDKTTSLLWQVVGLWLEVIVLDNERLKNELKAVQQDYRESRKQPSSERWSPSGGGFVTDVNPRVISPSRLTVYEKCESENGRLLLRWCATVSGIYGVTVRDFCESFRDGAALCLILHHYCPKLIQIDEITPVQQADLRSVVDSEAESTLVQKNFDLFTERSRSLGTIPHISIRAEAALAPSFVSADKDDSFGRVMELLSSYLFRSLVLEKEGSDNRDYVKQFVAEEWESKGRSSAPECDVSPSILADGQGVASDDVAHESPDPVSDIPDEIDAALGTSDSENGLSYHLTSEGAVNGSGEQAAKSSRPDSSSLEDAGKIILRHLRAAKSRREYLQKRDACLNIQAAVRGFLARKGLKMHSQEMPSLGKGSIVHANEYPFATKLYLKSWPEAASNDAGLKDISPDGSEADMQVVSQETRSVVAQVASVLPVLRRHMAKSASFAERMFQHEEAQTVVRLQHQSQDEPVSLIAAHHEINAQDSQVANSTIRNLASGVLGVARSFGWSLASAVESHRKSEAMNLVGALHSAENAYEKAMKDALQNAENAYKKVMKETALRRNAECTEFARRQNQNDAFQKTETDEELQAESDRQKDYAILHEAKSALEASMDVSESFVEGIAKGSDVFDIESSALESLNILDHEPEESLTDIAPTYTDEGRDEIENEMKEIRETERRIEQELDILHQDWDQELRITDEKLQSWRVLLMKSRLHEAALAFHLHMSSADQLRSNYLTKRRDLTLAGSRLDCEQQNASEEHESSSERLEAEVRALDSSELDTIAWDEEAPKWDRTFSIIHSAVESLETAESKWRATEHEYQFIVDEYDTDAQESEKLLEGYQSWLLEAVSIDRRLDEKIQKQTEAEENAAMREQLRERRRKAERMFTATMRQSNAAAAEYAKAWDERNAQLKKLNELEKDAKQRLEDETALLNDAQCRTDEFMNTTMTFVESFATPVRADRFPDVTSSSGIPSPDTRFFRQDRELRQLGDDMDEAVRFIEAQRAEDIALMRDEIIDNDASGIPLEEFSKLSSDTPNNEALDSQASSSARKAIVTYPIADGRVVQSDLSARCSPSTAVDIPEDPAFRHESMCNIWTNDTDVQSEPVLSATDPEENVADGLAFAISGPRVSPPFIDSSHEKSPGCSLAETSSEKSPSAARQFSSGSGRNILSPLENQMPSAASKFADLRTLGHSTLQKQKQRFSSPLPSEEKILNSAIHTKRYSVHEGKSDPEAGESQFQQSAPGLTLSLSDRKSSLANHSSLETSSHSESDLASRILVLSDDLDTTRDVDQSPLVMPKVPLSTPQSTISMPLMGPESSSARPSLTDERITDKPVRPESRADTPGDMPFGNALPRMEPHALDADFAKGPFSSQLPIDLQATIADGSFAYSPSHVSAGSRHRRDRELYRLSSQLDELTAGDVSPENVSSVIRNPTSSGRLDSILRRISVATSSHSVRQTDYSNPKRQPTQEKETSSTNIIKTIFIIIRQCTRSAIHASLVELGISVIRDMAKNEMLVDSIFLEEDWAEMLVTCMQFYRDNERILSTAAEAMSVLSCYTYAQDVVRGDTSIMRRIRGVYNILQMHSDRRRKCEDRLRRADMIIEAVRRRQENDNEICCTRFSQEIEMESKKSAPLPNGQCVQDSNRWLSELLERLETI